MRLKRWTYLVLALLILGFTGLFGQARENYDLEFENDKWKIDDNRILGWLRIEK